MQRDKGESPALRMRNKKFGDLGLGASIKQRPVSRKRPIISCCFVERHPIPELDEHLHHPVRHGQGQATDQRFSSPIPMRRPSQRFSSHSQDRWTIRISAIPSLNPRWFRGFAPPVARRILGPFGAAAVHTATHMLGDFPASVQRHLPAPSADLRAHLTDSRRVKAVVREAGASEARWDRLSAAPSPKR